MSNEKIEQTTNEFTSSPPISTHDEAIHELKDRSTQSDPINASHVERHLNDLSHVLIDDPNIDPQLIRQAEKALESGDAKYETELAELLENDSPYVSVRSAVSNVDDESMPINTIRIWTIGIFCMIVIPGINQLLSLRQPTTSIGAIVAVIVTYPIGIFLANVLPTAKWHTRFGSLTLNPGPFNVKEHTLLMVMCSMSFGGSYASTIYGSQKYIYNQDFGFGFKILIVWSTQLLGLGLASFTRRFLVWPSSMIWPSNLPYCAMLNSLHGISTSEGDSLGKGRFKFFWLVCGVTFLYQFFPTYIFTMLSVGNWFCLIAPDNVPLNQMLGTQSGVGLLPLTFDWNQITYVINPLATPWWAQAHTIVGFFVFFVITTPVAYYSNVWNGSYLPMFDSSSYDRFGSVFDVSRVTDNNSGTIIFNAEKYNEYSIEYIPTALAISYFLSFASVTAVVVHVALFDGKMLLRQMRSTPLQDTDIHMRLMSKYKESPFWWYGLLFVVSLAMGIAGVQNWPTGMHTGHFVLAIIFGAIFLLPIGVITAKSNQEVGLNMISELVVGYMLPGRPLAMMIFKTTMYMMTSQALMFISDQKLGHYMKIPPQTLFLTQVLSTVVGGLSSLAVQDWALKYIPDVCSKHQPDKFTCPDFKVFGTASEIWGLIGPKLLFNPGRTYNHLLYGFLVGALSPIPFWLIAKQYPNSQWRLVNMPVMFTATGNIPPATGINFTAPTLVGFLTQYVWKKYRTVQWAKYNYVLSAALAGATAISTVFIFFTLQFPNGPNQQFMDEGWWGNTAPYNTADALGTPFRTPDNKLGFAGTPSQIGQTA